MFSLFVGYAATCKMMVEGALCLVDPDCHAGTRAGGVLTPASAMGVGLVTRLREAEGGTLAKFDVVVATAEAP